MCFNTRLREEANKLFWTVNKKNFKFQYTPPWGGEHTMKKSYLILWKFQYTPPWGGELEKIVHSETPNEFQYTPPWGGELIDNNWDMIQNLGFNTRLREEANAIPLNKSSNLNSFNTRLREEAN